MKRAPVKPLVFGYVSARAGIPVEQITQDRDRLSIFAEHEGYAMAEVFIEPAEQASVALSALIDSAARRDVAAVLVPNMRDLGPDPATQQAARTRLDQAGIHVLVLLGGAP